MHEVAEFGVAAHWAYKDGVDDADEVQRRLDWMKQLLEVDTTADDADAFVDAVKTDLLSERVLVFTPAGDVVNLPRGSTPIDFAYHVHTEVGHRTIGARVNGEIVPLSHALATGDRVEVLTNRSSQYGPSADWLNIVVTRGARQKIKHHFRMQARSEQLESGRRSLERALRRRSLPVTKLTTKAKLEEVSKQLLNMDSADDLFLAIDSQRLSPKHVVEALVPELVTERKKSPVTELPKKSISGVYVDGLDAPANLAKCCSPVRGDDVIGYVTRGRGVSVHRADCPNFRSLSQRSPERVIQVSWSQSEGAERPKYPVDVLIRTLDRPGVLRDVTDVFMREKMGLVGVNTQTGRNVVRMVFTVRVDDTGRLQDVLRQVRDVSGVRMAERI